MAGNQDSPPHDFFDEDVESEKEFLDITTALSGIGLENLTSLTVHALVTGLMTIFN